MDKRLNSVHLGVCPGARWKSPCGRIYEIASVHSANGGTEYALFNAATRNLYGQAGDSFKIAAQLGAGGFSLIYLPNLRGKTSR